MMATQTSRITLVGAGPGDPDLITRRGWRALQTADVVLYDALISAELLAECPAGAKMIYVGKRAGRHAMSQQAINILLVDMAWQYGHAVRLKGGDPFVFGRGYEEVQYARQWGLPVEVVPGLSSATALTALQTIPLTHRNCARSFWVVTATTTGGHLSDDLRQAVSAAATVVILMGMRKIGEIARLFAEAGKGNLPVLIIQHGSHPQEKALYTTVRRMEQEAAGAGIGSPGILVLGEVVGLAQAGLAEPVFWEQVENLRA